MAGRYTHANWNEIKLETPFLILVINEALDTKNATLALVISFDILVSIVLKNFIILFYFTSLVPLRCQSCIQFYTMYSNIFFKEWSEKFMVGAESFGQNMSAGPLILKLIPHLLIPWMHDCWLTIRIANIQNDQNLINVSSYTSSREIDLHFPIKVLWYVFYQNIFLSAVIDVDEYMFQAF